MRLYQPEEPVLQRAEGRQESHPLLSYLFLLISQLRRVLDECADRLKPVMAQVFSLREGAGMETEEICKELNITPTNCWVLLHRARVFMRQCLELNGFSKAGAA